MYNLIKEIFSDPGIVCPYLDEHRSLVPTCKIKWSRFPRCNGLMQSIMHLVFIRKKRFAYTLQLFFGVKTICMKDYMNQSMQENPDHFILHNGTNDLCLHKSLELMQNLDLLYWKSRHIIRNILTCHQENLEKCIKSMVEDKVHYYFKKYLEHVKKWTIAVAFYAI